MELTPYEEEPMTKWNVIGWVAKDDPRAVVLAAQVSTRPTGKGVDYWRPLVTQAEAEAKLSEAHSNSKTPTTPTTTKEQP